MKRKEQISAWILLSVFVPMLLLSCLHVHTLTPNSIDCEQCVEHVHHAGHIKQYTAQVDDCVLCRFMGQRYVTAHQMQELKADAVVVAVIVEPVTDAVIDVQCGEPSLRAPPAIL